MSQCLYMLSGGGSHTRAGVSAAQQAVARHHAIDLVMLKWMAAISCKEVSGNFAKCAMNKLTTLVLTRQYTTARKVASSMDTVPIVRLLHPDFARVRTTLQRQ
jgi:hypothetical protein